MADESKMWVKFNSTQLFETLGRKHGPVYEEGKAYELRPDQAQRWIKRGYAEEISAADASKIKATPVINTDPNSAIAQTKVQPAASAAAAAEAKQK